MADMGLDGRVALVTGANHGIGAATAEALAIQSAAVFVTYLRLPADQDHGGDPAHARYQHIRAHAADEAARGIHELGGRATAWEADLADPATVPALFDRAEAALGPVEVLVNNADHCDPDTLRPSQTTPERSPSGTPVRTFTAASFDRHVAVNCRATGLLQRTDDEKVSKERMHLDLETDDVEAEVQRLEALGATRWDHQQERGFDFLVLRDPWGNEFCVLPPEFPELLARRRPWLTSGVSPN